MPLIIWQLYAILSYERWQRVNTLIKYSWEYSHFKCAYLAIWAVRKDRKWILKHKLSGKFPLDFGFYIPWEQVVLFTFVFLELSQCMAQNKPSINVYGINSIYHRSQPEISLLQLSSIWRITIFLSNWLCDFLTGQNSCEVPTNYLSRTNYAFVFFSALN